MRNTAAVPAGAPHEENDVHSQPEVVWQGQFINVVRKGRWEYVARKKLTGTVGIIAVTDERRIILVEQFRPPVNQHVVEIPAGLAGDISGQEGEPLEVAARRELLEETGYEAAEMVNLGTGVSTAGLSDECITLFCARGLRKAGNGGGDGSEQISVHEIELDGLVEFLDARAAAGNVIDLKILSGVYLAEKRGLLSTRA